MSKPTPEIIMNIVNWIRSPKGKSIIKKGQKRTEKNISNLSKLRQIDSEKLDEPIIK